MSYYNPLILLAKPPASGSSYDTDAQAFFTAVEATDTLTTTQKDAVNQLVLDMKAAGVWTKCKAIYPFVGGTSTAHKWNLKDPRDLNAAYRLTFTASPTHSSTGMALNGSSQYASTHFNCLTDFGSTLHLSVYNRNNTALGYDIGAFDGAPNDLMLASRYTGTGNAYTCYAGIAYIAAATSSATGLTSSSNNGSTTVLYKNGSSINASLQTPAKPNETLTIGGSNRWSGVVEFTNHEFAFVSIGDALSSGEMLALYNGVQAYQTTLGRQV